MPCYYPLIGIPTGTITKNGKPQLLVKSYLQLKLEGHSNHDYEKWMSNWSKTHNGLKPVLIPCQKCIGCRLEKSRQWADRCLLEMKYHDSALFLTLTYDDDHLKNKNGEKLKDGEHASLFKKDWQDFVKRLRKHYGTDKIRYFMCGEYGTSTYRPHYHAIVFGLHVNDIEFYKRTSNSDILYNSPTISRIWNNGFAVIGNVTWDTCAYTARYCCKKEGELNELYSRWDVNKQFTLCSRRPGLGRQYYEEYKDSLYKFGFINISTEKGGRKIQPPKYFDNLLAVDNPELSDLIKAIRQNHADDNNHYLNLETDMSDMERMMKDASVKEGQIKILQRSEI